MRRHIERALGLGCVAATWIFVACSEGSGQVTYSDGPSYPDGAAGLGTDGPVELTEEIPPPIDVCPPDPCPVPGGVKWRCQSRFMYGANLAWTHFSSDFGGLVAWGSKGVSRDPEAFSRRLAEMKKSGVNVVRWWMFPDFRGDGVRMDENGVPEGLAGSTLDDVEMALNLAQIHDVYLMLTLFSFDGFKPVEGVGTLAAPSIEPLVTDPNKRRALIDNVVRPIAQKVATHPHAIRMMAWDLMNEPEWAVSGEDPYGDPQFDPSSELTPVPHSTMESFFVELTSALREESNALVTVGAASLKWSNAWSGVDLDFLQFHYYGWMEKDYPYSRPPSFYSLGDVPVVMGEFPFDGVPDAGVGYQDLVESFYTTGFTGALGWDWNSITADQRAAVQAFSEAHACETGF